MQRRPPRAFPCSVSLSCIFLSAVFLLKALCFVPIPLLSLLHYLNVFITFLTIRESHSLTISFIEKHIVFQKELVKKVIKLLLLLSLFFKFTFFCVCVGVLLACICAPCVCLILGWSEYSVLSPGTRAGYEPPCMCWESNLGSLEEWPVLFITEPSPQFLRLHIFNFHRLWCFCWSSKS